jgi:hypothetical protein
LSQLQCHSKLSQPLADEAEGGKQLQKGTYLSYLLYPLVAELGAKSHTAALDLQKLESLRRPRADYVGLLLLGFDAENSPMDEDVSRLIKLAGLGNAPWRARSVVWNDPYREACGVKCWLWYRPVDENGARDSQFQAITISRSENDSALPVRLRAARVFKWFMDAELSQGEYFRWEMPIGQALRLPQKSDFVKNSGAILRKAERRFGKYDVRSFLNPERFRILLDTFCELVARGERDGWSRE